jgi:hypothetical protein
LLSFSAKGVTFSTVLVDNLLALVTDVAELFDPNDCKRLSYMLLERPVGVVGVGECVVTD